MARLATVCKTSEVIFGGIEPFLKKGYKEIKTCKEKDYIIYM